MSYDDAVEFLRRAGCSVREHSPRHSLLDHLIGVRNVLQGWDAPSSVCDAGLFHSVYGTDRFPTVSVGVDRRDEVREIIGEEAELLVFLFSARRHGSPVMQPHIEGRRGFELPVTDTQVRGLCNLLIANAVEQAPYKGRAYLLAELKAMKDLRARMLPAAADFFARLEHM